MISSELPKLVSKMFEYLILVKNLRFFFNVSVAKIKKVFDSEKLNSFWEIKKKYSVLQTFFWFYCQKLLST